MRLWSFCLPQIVGSSEDIKNKTLFLKTLIIECMQEIVDDLKDAEAARKFEMRYSDQSVRLMLKV